MESIQSDSKFHVSMNCYISFTMYYCHIQRRLYHSGRVHYKVVETSEKRLDTCTWAIYYIVCLDLSTFLYICKQTL